MNWDNVDWNNFSCVAMARAIKDEIDAKCPTTDAILEYLEQNRKKNRLFLNEERAKYLASKNSMYEN
jgi:hypothetical protein